MEYWLAAPGAFHLDALGLALVAATGAFLGVGLALISRARRSWRRNPFRIMLGHYLGRGAISLGLLTMIAAAAHIAGIPVYGTRAAGLGTLIFLLVAALSAGLGWRFHLAVLMRKYEERYPEVVDAAKGKAATARLVKLEAPMWFMLFIGAGAYLAFIWHPWNHIFHEGNIALGGLAGYAIGCLVGVLRYGAPPPPRGPAGPARKPKRPGRRG